MLTGVVLSGNMAMFVAGPPPTLTKKPKTSFMVSLLAAYREQWEEREVTQTQHDGRVIKGPLQG